jgi:ABC-type arginine transport system ATPase subunit
MNASAISLRNVNFNYGSLKVINDISLEIEWRREDHFDPSDGGTIETLQWQYPVPE